MPNKILELKTHKALYKYIESINYEIVGDTNYKRLRNYLYEHNYTSITENSIDDNIVGFYIEHLFKNKEEFYNYDYFYKNRIYTIDTTISHPIYDIDARYSSYVNIKTKWFSIALIDIFEL